MAFESIDQAEIDVKQPVTKPLMQKIKDSLDFLNGIAGGDGTALANGSMELDSDASGEPDSWTRATFSAGTVERTTTTAEVAHGLAAIKMVHPGGGANGGGTLESDYIACQDTRVWHLNFDHRATAAGMKNEVVVRYFDEAKSDLAADETIYSSTANPTAWDVIRAYINPPATARFMKIKLIGGKDDIDVAGSAFFDGLELSRYKSGKWTSQTDASGSKIAGFHQHYDKQPSEGGTVPSGQTVTPALSFIADNAGVLDYYFSMSRGTGTTGTASMQVRLKGVLQGSPETEIDPAQIEEQSGQLTVKAGDLVEIVCWHTSVGGGVRAINCLFHSGGKHDQQSGQFQHPETLGSHGAY